MADRKLKMMDILFNPFVYFQGSQSLLSGISVLLLTGFIGYFGNIHFNGVIDIQAKLPAPMWQFLFENIFVWLCMAAVLASIGKKILKSEFSIPDLFGTQALSRWPSVTISLLGLSGTHQRYIKGLEPTRTDENLIIAFIIYSILTVFWMVFLMYRSYSFSCKIKGKRAVISFIIGLIIAETLSVLIRTTFWGL